MSFMYIKFDIFSTSRSHACLIICLLQNLRPKNLLIRSPSQLLYIQLHNFSITSLHPSHLSHDELISDLYHSFIISSSTRSKVLIIYCTLTVNQTLTLPSTTFMNNLSSRISTLSSGKRILMTTQLYSTSH